MGLIVNIMRHGEAEYRDWLCRTHAPDSATDLTKQGAEDVHGLALTLYDRMRHGEMLLRWASPTARTLHTARILLTHWRAVGVAENRLRPVRVYRSLREWDFDDRNLLHVPFFDPDSIDLRDQLMHEDKLVGVLRRAVLLDRLPCPVRIVIITHDVMTRLPCQVAGCLDRPKGLEPGECLEFQVADGDLYPRWSSFTGTVVQPGQGILRTFDDRLRTYVQT